jgi:hypothetical protein
MLCPSCRATLFAGAFECRFCGKKLPQPSSARIPGLALIGIFLGVCALLAWTALSRSDAQGEQLRLRQAAACGATTAQKIGDAAGQMTAKSNISMIDAIHRAEDLACPALKGD